MELQSVNEIEQQITRNELTAEQVFEQMKQLVYRDAPCRAFCESKVYESKIAKLERLINILTLGT